jgi:alcohol dehydrogenase
MYSHCETGGWLLGHRIDGTQAEYVRVPHADTSLHKIPQGLDEDALVMLSDVLPTGYECGVLNGKVKPGDIVAIIGSGPIGLSALLTAQLYSPAKIIMVDLDHYRLEAAKKLGASEVINSKNLSEEELEKRILNLTSKGRGVNVAIEAVGVPASFQLCEEIIAPGGVIANIGVHGVKAELHLERLWDRNITITTRLVDTITTPMLLKIVESGILNPKQLITHNFTLNNILEAYDTFDNAASSHALKVIISRNQQAGATK